MKVANSSFHILIVDDLPENLQLLMSILSNEAYEIHVAQSGAEAVEKAHSIIPDLILLDIMMPGMDGFKTCQALKASKSTADIPVIFLTALTDTVDVVKGFEKGGVDYITKPFESAELLARVRTQLDIRSKENEIRQLSQAVEQSPASVMITDLEGRIEYVNPKFSDVTGYAAEEVLGKNPRILTTGEKHPKEYKELWDTITAGKEWKGEFHNQKKNGELYWESATIAPLRNNKGTFSHFIAITEDITEKKLADQKLLESYRTIKAQQALLIEELKQARKSHQSLLPLALPDIPNAHVAAKYVPLEDVGGDFYDVFEIEPNVFGLLVADVTGHGCRPPCSRSCFTRCFPAPAIPANRPNSPSASPINIWWARSRSGSLPPCFMPFTMPSPGSSPIPGPAIHAPLSFAPRPMKFSNSTPTACWWASLHPMPPILKKRPFSFSRKTGCCSTPTASSRFRTRRKKRSVADD